LLKAPLLIVILLKFLRIPVAMDDGRAKIGVAMDDAVKSFMEITGASVSDALKYVGQSKGEVDTAIAAYFEAQESGDAPEEPEPAAAPAPRAPPGPTSTDNIAAIMEAASGSDATGKGKGEGKGEGKSGPMPKPKRTVLVLFFEDGFTASELTEEERQEMEKQDEPEQAAAPAAAFVRRTGMATLNDFKDSKGPGSAPKIPKMPKLAQLRVYDTEENKAFLALIKKGRLPPELQTDKTEENGEPIATSIAVTDLRPKTYQEFSEMVMKLEKMRQMQEQGASKESAAKPASTGPALFTGAGHSLSSSAPSTAAASGGSAGAGSSGPGADPALVAIVGAAAKPEVDASKPSTTLQLRLSSGGRVRAQLNLDHTVADLWRLVAAEMGLDAFKAASNHALSAGFPPKPLTDLNISLADADLKNASVTHRCS